MPTKKSASSADAQKRRKKIAKPKKTASTAVRRKGGKPAKKRIAPKIKKPKERSLGKIDHYFDKISVAAMKLGDSLKVGDTVRIEGGSVAFTQQIASMQIEHELVTTAKKGDEVGFKVKQKVREGYRVFKA